MQSSLRGRVIAGYNLFANEFANDFAVATVDFSLLSGLPRCDVDCERFALNNTHKL